MRNSEGEAARRPKAVSGATAADGSRDHGAQVADAVQAIGPSEIEAVGGWLSSIATAFRNALENLDVKEFWD